VIPVGVIGHGTIGSVVVEALACGEVPGCRLAAVLTRTPAGAGRPAVPAAVASRDDLLASSRLVVEAADSHAVAEHGAAIVDAGIDLLVVSVGALADDRLRARLCTPSGGRLLLSSGAIGGLGLLRSAALYGPLREVRLTTTKPPPALERPWMTEAERARLRSATRPVTVYAGTARDAVDRFPQSVNVAATLALATVGFDETRVEVVADPAATRVRHDIAVEAAAGRYAVSIENVPSSSPRTSAVTPYAVLRALRDLTATLVVGV
jgi:aspartate dehydrogenase